MVIAAAALTIICYFANNAKAQDVLPDGKQNVLLLDSTAAKLGISARVQIYFCKECQVVTPNWKQDTVKIVWLYWYIERTANAGDSIYTDPYKGFIRDKKFFVQGVLHAVAPAILNRNPENNFGTIGLKVNTNHLDKKITVTFAALYNSQLKDYDFKISKGFWLDLPKEDVITEQSQPVPLIVKTK